MRWITLPLLCAALWLTGCASTRLVDSDVQSFSQLAGAPARATYSFERLPSQQAQGAQQSAVEEQARLAQPVSHSAAHNRGNVIHFMAAP